MRSRRVNRSRSRTEAKRETLVKVPFGNVRSWRTAGQHLRATEPKRFLKFILMVPANWRPTSASSIDVLVEQPWSFAMSNTSAKIAIALLLAFASPAASFARTAGQAGAGNVPISGIPPGPANVGGINNINVDPSGIGNAARVAALPQPHITVPTIPHFK
jgi:hypothetical protein